MSTFTTVLLIILAVALVLLVALYFLGRNMQQKQLESQKMLEASSQLVTMLIIDKKKMKLKEAPLPKQVYEQTPAWGKLMKIGVVKAKIGPRIVNLVADGQVFKHLPLKAEVKAKISGIYITEITKGAVLTEKEIEKNRKKKEKEAKKAAKK
ncbi:MAG: hypothetical protein Q4B67_06525 [Eubacteriales bacterium]|nr:hypothetical protein [Eubacteriales bacterium]